MEKYDYKKELAVLYNPPKKAFTFVDVPAMNFLSIEGHGDPNNSLDYQEVVSTLYSVSYTLKFALKGQGIDFGVAPLEGLWWMENMAEFSLERKQDWDWTMMIMQPDFVTAEQVEDACNQAAKKKELSALPRLRFESFHEGLSIQTMYLGAYADEGPTIAQMHAHLFSQGYETGGKHHEIYLSDPKRTAPEKLKTIIRQPVKKVVTG